MYEDEGASIDKMFLDPQGRNLEELEKALVSSVRLFRLWWTRKQEIGSPRLSADEITKLVSASERDFAFFNLSSAYAKLEPCIKILFQSMRFNKNNMMNVHPTPLLPSVASSLFAMLQNPNNLSPLTSPATTIMEEDCIILLSELVGFCHKGAPAHCGGNLLSCGSLSNLTALMVAREKVYSSLGSTESECLRETGLFRAQRGIVLTSDSAHYSIQKAVRVLGMGDLSLVKIPVASTNEIAEFEKSGMPLRLKPSKEDYSEAIEKAQRRAGCSNSESQRVISAVPTLGTINTGTIEPIKPLVELKNEFGFHLHVDAAIGGFALGLSDVKAKASGVEFADSITIDPHKLGYVHYPCSALIFRKKSDLETIAIDAPYVGPSASTIEGSRPGTSAASLWVALKTLGFKGYNRILGECIRLTKGFARLLAEAGFQVLHEIDLNTVCFSVFADGTPRKRLNRLTDQLHSRLVAAGRFLPGKVEDLSGVMVRDRPWQADSERVGVTAIKTWIMNPCICESDLESLLDELVENRKEITGSQ